MVATTSGFSSGGVLLLDTNILLLYSREGTAADKLEAILGLRSGRMEAVVSDISMGESLALAARRNWGTARRRALDELLRNRVVPVGINSRVVQEAYAEVVLFSERQTKPARTMGQNDAWIAATARALNCTLVTTDRDFDHLHDGKVISRQFIDQRQLR